MVKIPSKLNVYLNISKTRLENTQLVKNGIAPIFAAQEKDIMLNL